MRQILFIVFILFFGSYISVAQKIIEKEFYATEIFTLSIIDDNIFNIIITSSKRESIVMKMHISGEHSEAIIIEESYSAGTLSLKTGLMPYFAFENDKLAAHKLMAVEMELYVPESISIIIKSKLASVTTTGNIENLDMVLENGNCFIADFLGNAHLKTDTGNISVSAKKKVSGKAISQNGKCENKLPKNGQYLIEAESINGNIYMLQTK